MPNRRPAPPSPGSDDDLAAAVLAACRVLVGVSAMSMAAVEDVADLVQVRALVVIASRGPLSLRELSEATRLHLTRTSRLCDRLVGEGLVHRGEHPTDRRQLVLTLTEKGRRVVDTVVRRRREALAPILTNMRTRMTTAQRADLTALLRDFAAVGGEPDGPDLWALGWS